MCGGVGALGVRWVWGLRSECGIWKVKGVYPEFWGGLRPLREAGKAEDGLLEGRSWERKAGRATLRWGTFVPHSRTLLSGHCGNLPPAHLCQVATA